MSDNLTEERVEIARVAQTVSTLEAQLTTAHIRIAEMDATLIDALNECDRLRAENARLKQDDAAEIDEFNMGFQAGTAGLDLETARREYYGEYYEVLPHDRFDVFGIGYAAAGFEKMKAERDGLIEVLTDKRRLTHQLDEAISGEGDAAEQASLCDLIEPARRLREEHEKDYADMRRFQGDVIRLTHENDSLTAQLAATREALSTSSTEREKQLETQRTDLLEENRRLAHDLHAYRGALGYTVPGDHDGRLVGGNWPANKIAIALTGEVTRLAAADNPNFDATDGAAPAWWRGHDHTTKVFCALVNDILDGKDDGSGANREPWASTRKRLLGLCAEVLRMSQEIARLEGEFVEVERELAGVKTDNITGPWWVSFECMLSQEQLDAIGLSEDRGATACITRLASAYTYAEQEANRQQAAFHQSLRAQVDAKGEVDHLRAELKQVQARAESAERDAADAWRWRNTYATQWLELCNAAGILTTSRVTNDRHMAMLRWIQGMRAERLARQSDDNARLRAALAQVGEAGWQAIETAPKDGTHILVCWASRPFDKWWTFNQAPPAVVHWYSGHPNAEFEGFYLSHGLVQDSYNDVPQTPTHWRPLPEPPAGAIVAASAETTGESNG